MDVALLNPGQYLKSQELRGDETFTITGVEVEELEDVEGGKKVKGIIYLRGSKPWVGNVTNAMCLKAMFGRETDRWIGKRVTLYAAPWKDQVTKEDTTCIRVRGSPDLAADITFTLRLARKRPQQVVMRKTVPGQRPELPSERLVRLAKEAGYDKDAIKAVLEEIAPGKVKVQRDVTDELADQVLARLKSAPAAPPAEAATSEVPK
jgi:hypothetical protein